MYSNQKYGNKKLTQMSVLCAWLVSGLAWADADVSQQTEALQAEEAVDANRTADEAALAVPAATSRPVDEEGYQGLVVMPTPEAVEFPRVKSMQDNAERALATGKNETDGPDRILALLVVLGLAAFSFLLRKRDASAGSPSPEPLAPAEEGAETTAVAPVPVTDEAVDVAGNAPAADDAMEVSTEADSTDPEPAPLSGEMTADVPVETVAEEAEAMVAPVSEEEPKPPIPESAPQPPRNLRRRPSKRGKR